MEMNHLNRSYGLKVMAKTSRTMHNRSECDPQPMGATRSQDLTRDKGRKLFPLSATRSQWERPVLKLVERTRLRDLAGELPPKIPERPALIRCGPFPANERSRSLFTTDLLGCDPHSSGATRSQTCRSQTLLSYKYMILSPSRQISSAPNYPISARHHISLHFHHP